MSQDNSWEAQAEEATKRYRERLNALRDELGPDASIVEVEALLVEHENAIMRDALDALTEGVSPPSERQSDT